MYIVTRINSQRGAVITLVEINNAHDDLGCSYCNVDIPQGELVGWAPWKQDSSPAEAYCGLHLIVDPEEMEGSPVVFADEEKALAHADQINRIDFA